MKRITKITLSLAVPFALGLVLLQQATSAENRCKEAKGNLVEAFDPGSNTTTGTLSDGGWLDGTTVAVFNSGAYPTPVPKEVTFTSTFTLTTNHGKLNGDRIYLLDLVTGQGMAMVKIDPTTSTGVFAGATGVVFFGLIKSTTVAVGPYYEVVSGQICFAHGSDPPEE